MEEFWFGVSVEHRCVMSPWLLSVHMDSLMRNQRYSKVFRYKGEGSERHAANLGGRSIRRQHYWQRMRGSYRGLWISTLTWGARGES